jgi:hypothetical protein
MRTQDGIFLATASVRNAMGRLMHAQLVPLDSYIKMENASLMSRSPHGSPTLTSVNFQSLSISLSNSTTAQRQRLLLQMLNASTWVMQVTSALKIGAFSIRPK